MPLFTAGPAQISPQVSALLSLPPLHHRSKEFRALFDFAHDALLQLCALQEVFFLCSSGSGAMESAISSLSPSHVLVLENGKFSKRWGEIAQHFGITTTWLSCPWDRTHHKDEVKAILEQERGIDGVCICAVESSGGVREEYEEIAQLIKEHNPSILTFLDGIALFGSEELHTSCIDVLVASSQKALGLPVGLGFVFLSSYALSLLHSRPPKSFYLALQNYLKDPIAFSLPSQLFLALEFVLKHTDFAKNYTLIQHRFELTQALLSQFNIPLYAKNPSNSIIAFEDPHGKIRLALQKENLWISEGQSHLKEHISRIGNFGGFQDYEILLDGLYKGLKSL